MKADGTDTQQLTDNSVGDLFGDKVWSPLDKIVFHRALGPPQFNELFWMNADGTGQQQLTNTDGLNLFAGWGMLKVQVPSRVTRAPTKAPTGVAAAGAATPRWSSPLRRTRKVLRLLTEGLSDREIAEALFVSPRTVGKHVTNILAKFGVGSRAAAAAHAVRCGHV